MPRVSFYFSLLFYQIVRRLSAHDEKSKKKLSAFSSFPEWKLCGTEKSAGMYSHLFPTMYETNKRRRKRKKGIIRREREKWQIAFSAEGEKKPQKREFRMKEGEKMNKNKNKKIKFFFQSKFWISKRHTQINYFWLFEQKGQQGHSSKIV